MSSQKPIVQSQFLSLALPPGGFRLSSGETLPEINVAYETYGELAPDKKNVIYVCHALTGDAHAAFYHREEDDEPGWWDPMIGPGKTLDTSRFFVVCANILGGCKGTTGPAAINPATGKPYALQFPLITIKDVVNVQKQFLDQLGIPELYCVVGGSMGGMQALEWSIAYPDYVKRCICIASAINLTPQALAFDIIGRQEIESDPHWHDGEYSLRNDLPGAGLSRARQIGHVTYLSSISMERKFGRETQADSATSATQPSKFSTNFQVESYLNYQGRKFVKRFDANSYLYISRMMDMFDLVKEHGSIEQAFRGTQCHFLIVSISTDWLFPEEQQLEIVSALLALRKRVSYFQLDSHFGHDAFLIEYDAMGRGVAAFLREPDRSISTEAINRVDIEHIAGMIHDGAHVLDVGSGGGDVFCALKERKRISGICLDIDFGKVVQCMRKGLPTVQLDGDTGLGIIGDDSFDLVLLYQTIQQMRSGLGTIKQMVRIAPRGIIGFPNFAYYRYRIGLCLKGTLPVSETLPFEWYNTPNIHLVTIKDFRELCRKHNIHIDEIQYLADDILGKLLIGLGRPNVGGERSLVKIGRTA